MSTGSGDSLFQFGAEDYGGSFKADLLEQYKLYVQSAENVSARRVQSSRYLLTSTPLWSPCTAFSLPASARTIGRWSFQS